MNWFLRKFTHLGQFGSVVLLFVEANFKTEEQLVGLIRKQVKMRIGSLLESRENVELSSRWGFSILSV